MEYNETRLVPDGQEIIVNVQGGKRLRDRLGMTSVRPPFTATAADSAVPLTLRVKLPIQIQEFNLYSAAEKLNLLTFRC